jgi:hypothetical protein
MESLEVLLGVLLIAVVTLAIGYGVLRYLDKEAGGLDR